MRTVGVLIAVAAMCASCKLGSSGSADGGTSGGGLMKTLAGLVGFEGEIEMVTTGTFSSSSSTKMLFTIKKDKLRIELPGMPLVNFVFLIDGAKKKMWWLTPSTKSYIEMPMPTTTPTTTTTKPTATKTGKTDTVAGYSCDEWQVTDSVSHVRTLTCVSSGLSFLGLGASPLKDLGGGTWMDALGTTGFPLRAETFDASGTLINKMEATRIEKKSEPDSLFEIPPGYTASGGIGLPTATTPPPPKPTGRPLTSAPSHL
jgi:hypothetical protein